MKNIQKSIAKTPKKVFLDKTKEYQYKNDSLHLHIFCLDGIFDMKSQILQELIFLFSKEELIERISKLTRQDESSEDQLDELIIDFMCPEEAVGYLLYKQT